MGAHVPPRKIRQGFPLARRNRAPKLIITENAGVTKLPSSHNLNDTVFCNYAFLIISKNRASPIGARIVPSGTKTT